MTEENQQAALSRWAENRNKAYQKNLDWIRQMLSLSFAGLTTLVAFQGNYTPNSVPSLYFLWATFLLLAASVLASAIALRGEVLSLRSLCDHTLDRLNEPTKNYKLPHVSRPPRMYVIAENILPYLLALSVLSMAVFAILNTLKSPDEQRGCTPVPVLANFTNESITGTG